MIADFVWIALTALACVAALRYWLRLRRLHSSARHPIVDERAIERIIRTGSLETDDEDPLDVDEAARAEDEFWSESWDEPEEFNR